MRLTLLVTFFLFLLSSSCQTKESIPVTEVSTPVNVTSLFGKSLSIPEMTSERAEKLHKDYDEAKTVYNANPNDAEAIIWLGRRAGYLWHYQGAIDWFSKGIELHPDDPRMYRHRGHRYITVRQFDNAIADLKKAASLIEGTEDEIEPDGAPNAAGIPTSTLHTNIWYHLGLAYYLKGNFEDALSAYQKCMEASKNNDMIVATADWLYMTLRRLNRNEEAQSVLNPITEDMALLENFVYHRRLLMYKGLLPPDSLLTVKNEQDRSLNLATQGYGVGNWYLYNDQTETAKEIFEEVLRGEYWAAFGYIAAEAELFEMQHSAP